MKVSEADETALAAQISDSVIAARCATPDESSGEPVVVRTTAGDLRGTFQNGVFAFKGVRYGEDTTARRFRRAEPVRPWKGVRDALEFGPQCIQPESPDFELLRSGWDQPSPSNEDCLCLNIWTPSLDDQRRRPVMFNLHGGAWTVGSGNSSGRSGERFARRHDIVRVNVNHRLGIFGFSNFAEILGPEFADSANVGILDVVLSLRWIRDNIAAFGGDPDNVTIFGVSGGGAKVSTLMAMPAANGLFHKASVESGPMLTANSAEAADSAADRLLGALEIPRNKARDLLSLSGEQLLAGYMKIHPDGGLTSSGLGPVVDGVNLPRHPFDPTAPAVSDHVPLLIGTTAMEMSLFIGMADPSIFEATWEDLPECLPSLLPHLFALTPEDIQLARGCLPGATPAEAIFAFSSERFMRSRSIKQAELASRRSAPVYMWLIEWNTPVDGGKWGSPHGMSVPLIMDTVAASASLFGDDLGEPQALCDKMSAAWAAFARTGAPDTPGLPHWPAYDANDRATMIFDTRCRVENDPYGDLRRLCALP
jgi:para-nitrobenzyl esterase